VADDPKTYTEEEFEQAVTARAAEAAAGLKANRDELLREAKKAKDALKAYDGIDPSEYKALKAAAEEAERKRAVDEGNFASLEKQLVDRHQKEIGVKEARIEKLNRALERRLVEAKLAEALAKAEADPSMMPLLLLEGQRHVRVRETEDDFEEYVADERGNPLVADGKGTPMDVQTFVGETLKAKYPSAFRGSGSTGGGAGRSGAAGGTRTISAADNAAFMANLADIAKGTVKVQQ